ncbi:MAG TPA: Ycf66 family protein [Thermosynechococcaceae cyanobacterium]
MAIGLVGSNISASMMPMQPLLAQVNIGSPVTTILGLALASSGVALYALRSLRPRLARDYDIFFSAVALLCGCILIFQGWRLDPILLFGQVLLTGTAVFFAVEGIRLRGITTEQAKRNTSIEDYDRPVNPSYRYEATLDELDAFEERARRPRIQGSKDSRPSREEYEEEAPRRRNSRSSDDRLGTGGDRPSRGKRRPRPDQSAPADYTDYTEYREEPSDESINRPARNRRTPPTRAGNQSPGSTRSKRPRPSDDAPRRERDRNADVPPSEYVDYRPVDDEDDNWGDDRP